MTVHRAVTLPVPTRTPGDLRPVEVITADLSTLRVQAACWRTVAPAETGPDVDCPGCLAADAPTSTVRLTAAHARMLSALIVARAVDPGNGVHVNRIRALLTGQGLLDAAGNPTPDGRDALAAHAGRRVRPAPSTVLTQARARAAADTSSDTASSKET